MRSQPLISVVMATYQGDDLAHLRIAIDSILCQSHKNLELQIICDGPIDPERIDYLQSLPSNVFTHLSTINQGPAAARNIGIDKSNGEFIAIMDADDISVPSRLSDQLLHLTNENLDLVSSSLNVIDSEGKQIGFRNIPISHGEIKKLAPLRCPMHNPSAFGRASIFRSFKYDTRLRVAEDYDLWIRLLLNDRRLGNTNTPLVNYRQPKNSIKKRLGLKYATSDFSIKLRAVKLAPLHERGFFLTLAVITGVIRLFPESLFLIFYKFRTKIRVST